MIDQPAEFCYNCHSPSSKGYRPPTRLLNRKGFLGNRGASPQGKEKRCAACLNFPLGIPPSPMAADRLLAAEEAEAVLAAFPVAVEEETVALPAAQGRFLARDILSPRDLPEFDKSAMDGYAVIAADSAADFAVVETIAAGAPPLRPLSAGLCSRIMTGAMLPAGADRVVKRECATEVNGRMRIVAEDAHDNVRRRGEDLRAGQVVLAAGERLGPAAVALLASLGLHELPLSRPPRVGVITTGSELTRPGSPLAPGRIYESNSYSLAAQLRDCGAAPVPLSAVADREEETARAIAAGLASCDALILSGGVSAGDFDFVPAAMERAGAVLHFRRIAVQPGMPTVFASRDGRPLFGLPGNPVSTFVIFEVFIRPLLSRWLGHAYRPLVMPALLAAGFRRARAERTLFLPVCCRDGRAELVDYHGSAHLHALSRANALLRVPAGQREIAPGSLVDVRFL